MSYLVKSTIIALLLAVLVACSAPTTPVPTLEPTSVPVAATAVATAIPVIQSTQVSIPTGEGDEMIQATITGNGDVAVMVHKTRWDTDTTSSWTPLVDSLSANERLRIVTYTVQGYETALQDSRIVFDYLRAEGIAKIICISAGIGQVCTDLQKEPEMVGMIKFPGDVLNPVEAEFPKLFVTAETLSAGFAENFRLAYDRSAEPKTFKSYASTAEGPGIFSEDIGAQVIFDITDFVNRIVSGQ